MDFSFLDNAVVDVNSLFYSYAKQKIVKDIFQENIAEQVSCFMTGVSVFGQSVTGKKKESQKKTCRGKPDRVKVAR